jgi:hypothetical protein
MTTLSPHQGTQLTQLILRLNELLDSGSPLLKTITYPYLLLHSLEELNELVEMNDVKTAIAAQIRFLLVSASRRVAQHKDLVKDKFDGHLLNTVIYGGAGLGKSTVGVLLAKIWTSLGLTKPGPVQSQESLKEVIYLTRIVDLRGTVNTQKNQLRRAREALLTQREKVAEIRRGVIRLKPSHPLPDTETIWDNLILKTLDVRMRLDDVIKDLDLKEEEELIRESTSDKSEKPDRSETRIEKPPVQVFDKNESKVEIPITIVSRADLVAEYVGQSAIKTLNLLNRNLGRVVFIDEAYSLINGDRDSFGIEVLTTINKFMSEHPNDIIIIFAGYKEMMQETIFKYQPGLRRRCSWVFEIKGYSPQGLADIFRKQVTATGWSIDPSLDLVSFFQRHHSSFPSFGGDTAKLAFYCKLAYSAQVFDTKNLSEDFDLVLTQHILDEGLRELQKNDATPPNSNAPIPGMYL